MNKIVIIGSGFAGINTAKHLLRKKSVEVTLISRHDYFLFSPLLHEVATGLVEPGHVTRPVKNFFSGNFRFVKGLAEGIDTKEKKVYGEGFEESYDFLVLALGSCTNYFGVSGAKEHAHPIRSLEETMEIRRHVLPAIDDAMKISDPVQRQKAMTFIIVGAGPTGVELAGDLAEVLKTKCDRPRIIIVDMALEPLNSFSEYFRAKARKRLEKVGAQLHLGCSVKEVGPDYVIDSKGHRMEARAIFWGAGFRPNTVPIDSKTFYSYPVDARMKTAYDKVFALGDCSHLEINGTKVPMLAQVAEKQAKVAAHNILHELGMKKNPSEYSHKLDGLVVNIGKFYAIAEVKGKSFDGFRAWVFRKVIDGLKIPGMANRLGLIRDWLRSTF